MNLYREITNDFKLYNKEPNLLIRVGKTKLMKENYDNCTITFSCAANWIDYAIKHNDNVTGDTCEGAFARIPYPISTYYNKKLIDSKGMPLGNNLLITPVDNRDFCFLRYMPVILMPAICFYAIDCESLLAKDKKSYARIPLNHYAIAMLQQPQNSSVLVIKDMRMFQAELKEGLVNAITMSNLITNSGFVHSFDCDNPFVCKGIDYKKDNYESNFFENHCNAKALFIKQNRYKWQREFRIVVNHLRFRQIYQKDNYDFTINQLQVKLPNLKEYSELISLNEWNGLYLHSYDKERFFVTQYK